MTKTIGIIPAGGNAERFKGLSKELLPVSVDDCAMSRCIKSMQIGGATEIYIATKQDKIKDHWQVIKDMSGIHLTAREFRGLWDFIAFMGESVKADRYFFAMPDTVYPTHVFINDTPANVTCGTFRTFKPYRFGILCGNVIEDKTDKLGYAWGVWVWSRKAMEFLANACRETKNHTGALNLMLARFGVDTFEMSYYYDFATFEDYMEFLCSLT